MEKVKTPLYILYYIDFNNQKLVKDSVIYDSEIISSQDLASSTQMNNISITVPKYRNAMSGECYTPEMRWLNIANNQRDGDRFYYIVSSNSYNSTDYLEDPIYTNTARPTEGNDGVIPSGYRPYFAGYMSKIDILKSSDTITFTFSGCDWYYTKRIMDPDQTKLRSSTTLDDMYSQNYDFASFSWSNDVASPGWSLPSQDVETRVPIFVTEGDSNNPGNEVFNTYGSTTSMNTRREGLHRMKFGFNCKHTGDSPISAVFNLYRDANINEEQNTDSDGNPITKVLLGSVTIQLEANVTAPTMGYIDLQGEHMVDIPATDLAYRGTNAVPTYYIWVEGHRVGGTGQAVYMESATAYVSTYCYSLDHDNIYPRKATFYATGDLWNARMSLQAFFDSWPRQIMDSGKIRNWNNTYDDVYHFNDPIMRHENTTTRMSGLELTYPELQYNFNKFQTSVYTASMNLLDQLKLLGDWGTFLYSDGGICCDLVGVEPRDVPIYTDYFNTDILYNIKDDYYNHYYNYFGSTSDKPDTQYHTASHTTKYLNPNGYVQKDPFTMMKGFRYEIDDAKDTNKTEEDIWNDMGADSAKKAEDFERTKYQYVYYPEDDFVNNVRIGDWFVSTPESPIQLRRRITSIGRVCDNGLIKWVYKMEGDE